MSTNHEIGGPELGDRQLIYAQMGLSEPRAHQIEKMVAECGVRVVAAGALTNVRVRFYSAKNRARRILESHTCEQICAYEFEFNPDVIGYYAQVPCRRVCRITQNGRLHVSTAHLDFLVFRRGCVELIECKQRSWLEKKATEPGSQWTKSNGCWSYPPYADWAAQLGIGFSIWTPPDSPGIYLRNLEVCYAVLRR